MARTRNASAAFSQSAGVLLGKGGEPLNPTARVPDLDRQGQYISPAAAHLQNARNMAGSLVLKGPGAEPAPRLGEIVGYRADEKSWSKNMEAHELARLIDMLLRQPGDLTDGFVVDVSPAEFAAMDGNLKRHFMAVRE